LDRDPLSAPRHLANYPPLTMHRKIESTLPKHPYLRGVRDPIARDGHAQNGVSIADVRGKILTEGAA
jgi:hypothetical protein